MPVIRAIELARELGVSPAMITHYKKAGRIAPEPNGRYDLDKVKAQLAANLGEKRGGPPRRRDQSGYEPPVEVTATNGLFGVDARVLPDPVPESVFTKLTLPGPVSSPRAEEIDVVDEAGKENDPAESTEPRSGSKSDLEKQVLAERIRRERLRNDQFEGTLIVAADVEAHVESRFRAEAEAFLNWPSRKAAEMAAELGVDRDLMRVVLEKYVREFMSERSAVPAPALAA